MHYDVSLPDELRESLENLEKIAKNAIDNATPDDRRFKGRICPYASKATPAVVDELINAAKFYNVDYRKGITITNSGFFAPQGRNIARIRPTVPEIDKMFAGLKSNIPDLCYENMDMETSFLLHFMDGLGYNVGSICPIIAHRREDTFAEDYAIKVGKAVKVAFLALYNVRQKQQADR